MGADGDTGKPPRRSRAKDGLPHNWETERALLGGVILDSAQLPDVLDVMRPEDFVGPQHERLWRLLVELYEKNGRFDIVSVLDELEARAAFDAYGGGAYVVALPQACPTVDHIPVYARRVRDVADRRRLLLALQAAIEGVRAPTPDPDRETPPSTAELADRAMSAIQAVRDGSQTTVKWHEIGPVVDEVDRKIQEAHERPGHATGLPTGFVDLDKLIGGLEPTRMYVLGATPKTGKSSFALDILRTCAIRGFAGGIFSMEMGRDQLVTGMLSQQARVDARKMLRGQGEPDDWNRWMEASEIVHRLPIRIDDTPGLSIDNIRARARAMKRDGGLRLVIVDYLQLATSPEARKQGREQEVASVSRGLKGLAKELEVPVLVLAQLSRGLNARTNKRPVPSDLRESGAIEADADVVLFLYRDELYNPDTPDRGLAEVIVAYNRSGPTGTVKLAFIPQFTLFQNYANPADGPYY